MPRRTQDSWFAIGQRVRIREEAKKANRKRVKEDTWGTVNDVFEVVSYNPPMVIDGDEVPAAYWISPVGKPHSTVCMYEDELIEE